MKKTIALLLCLCLALCLFAGCARTGPEPAATEAPAAEPVELIVFAAASMTETMNRIAEMYKKVAPNVTIRKMQTGLQVYLHLPNNVYTILLHIVR